MDATYDPELRERVRAAWEAVRQGFAETEEIVFREKCAILPVLSIEKGLEQFSHLYQMALACGAGIQRHPALEERHIAETAQVRQRFIQAAPRQPLA